MFYDVLVIGAGQAGLAIGYYLKQTKCCLVFKGSTKMAKIFKMVYSFCNNLYYYHFFKWNHAYALCS